MGLKDSTKNNGFKRDSTKRTMGLKDSTSQNETGSLKRATFVPLPTTEQWVKRQYKEQWV